MATGNRGSASVAPAPPATMTGNPRPVSPGRMATGLDGPRCPVCKSTFVVRPHPWDARQLWRCERCGAAWTAPTEPEPVARRHLANPLFVFPWPPKEDAS